MKRAMFLAFIALIIGGCGVVPASLATETVNPTNTPLPADYPWWTEKVGYEIFVRSFYDSDGDGIGDFNGITQKLDYLNDGDPTTTSDLGVSAIWLMPIFPTPSYHGYDVTDYYDVNPQYGTMEDFRRLVDEAHKRGIKVIIDMVLNHTSDLHPWFTSADKDINSPYRGWYIWSETDPGYKGPDDQTVWHPSPTGFYYGLFDASMPDLNYANPDVTAEMDKVTSFWLQDVGVDGFRLDAIKHLIENNRMQENTHATHEWLKEFHKTYKSMNPNAITIGELYGNNVSSLNTYTMGGELDLAFNFDLSDALVISAKVGSALTASRAYINTDKILEPRQYSPFLTNHDQNRVLSELGGNLDKAKVAASLLLTSPGMPFIYYGEEIGMEGTKPDEDIRRPMQWSSSPNGGFTLGTPWEPLNPSFNEKNVEDQISDPKSLLSHYRDLIQIRNAHPVLQSGEQEMISTGNNQVFASLRSNDEEGMIVLINLSDKPASEYALSVDQSPLNEENFLAKSLMGEPVESPFIIDSSGGFNDYKPLDTLPPYSTTVILLTPSTR